MDPRTIRVGMLSDQVHRAPSIVDDELYQAQRQRPLLPRFARTLDGKSYEYDPAAAYICAAASAWAYSNIETLRSELKDIMEVDLECFQFSASNPTMYLDSDAYLVLTKNAECGARYGILAFRGTEFTSVGDLLADAYLEMVPFPYAGNEKGKVHGGFYQGMRAIWKRVYAMLVHNMVDHLVITGHSLGAALAVMTAAQIYRELALGQDERFQKVAASLRGVYTFGQPAIGNAHFAAHTQDTFGGLCFRHVYAKDVVPYLPTADINAMYQHFKCGVWTCRRSEERWSGPNSDRIFNTAKYLAPTLGLALVDFATRRFPFRLKLLQLAFDRLSAFSLDDHSPMHYLRISELSYLTAPQATTVWNPTQAVRVIANAAQ